jgi:hypothetical protein
MNLRIINQLGILIADYNILVVQGIPVQVDVKRLSSGIYTIMLANINARSGFSGRFVVVK